MSEVKPKPTVLFISPDLFFASKIQAVAEPLGLGVLQCDEFRDVQGALTAHDVTVVLIDLNARLTAISDLMNLLPTAARPLVVAFGPHVNTQRLEEARLAGCDHVLPRSRFVVELPRLLQQAICET